MSRNTELLGSVLSEIIANRANLSAQLEQQEKAMAQGRVQIEKFDALIASLQVSTGDSAIQAMIDEQAGANAALTEGASSPTDAAPEAANSAAAVVSDSSETDDYDAHVASAN